MVATVRLDKERERMLEEMAKKLHRKKSEILREALDYYARHVLNERQKRMEAAVSKVCEADKKESRALNGTLSDGL